MKRSFDGISISSDLVNTRPPAANSAVLSLPMLAVPSRISQRLPHITPHDVAEIDAEVREVLTEISRCSASTATAKRPPTRTLIQTYRAPIPDR